MAEISDETDLFRGGNIANECAEFVRSVRAHAFAQGKMRDDEWIADYAGTRMTDAAGIWFEYLEEETQTSWKLLRRALMDKFAVEIPSPRLFVPTPAAVATAPHQTSYPSVSNYSPVISIPTAADSESDHSNSEPATFSISPETVENVIKHRVVLLSRILPAALSFGKDNEGDSGEGLKNLDHLDMVSHADTSITFSVQMDSSRNRQLLSRHASSWRDHSGHNLDGLQVHLNRVADLRIQHVGDWLDANIGRFPASNMHVRALRQAFEDCSQALRSNLQLCLAECGHCRLHCVLRRAHGQVQHDCNTSHLCPSFCSVLAGHEGIQDCGLPAAHDGRHICDVVTHLCRQPCSLDTKTGCQKHCTLPLYHKPEEHLCPAKIHQCGERCDVRSTRQDHPCRGLCSQPCNDEHIRHSCDNCLFCPFKCLLCEKYCSTWGHPHGSEAKPVHLCWQEHCL